jgi:hypothetical protein
MMGKHSSVVTAGISAPTSLRRDNDREESPAECAEFYKKNFGHTDVLTSYETSRNRVRNGAQAHIQVIPGLQL